MYREQDAIMVRMTKVRTTKNTVRYESHEEGTPISTLYVGKDAFGGGSMPETVRVVVSRAAD